MLYFVNPGGAPKGRRRRSRATGRKRRRRHVQQGEPMAAKRKRRRRRSVATNPRRRRRHLRKNPGRFALHANPSRRRRRRRSYMSNPRRRRHYRRNPGGIAGTLIQGLKDGAMVIGGQVLARKLRGAVQGMLPRDTQVQVSNGAGAVALSLASAVLVASVARRFVPGQSRMLAAGAFAEAAQQIINTSGLSKYLAAPTTTAVPATTTTPAVAAWPGSGAPRLMRGGVAAWPGATRPAMRTGTVAGY